MNRSQSFCCSSHTVPSKPSLSRSVTFPAMSREFPLQPPRLSQVMGSSLITDDTPNCITSSFDLSYSVPWRCPHPVRALPSILATAHNGTKTRFLEFHRPLDFKWPDQPLDSHWEWLFQSPPSDLQIVTIDAVKRLYSLIFNCFGETCPTLIHAVSEKYLPVRIAVFVHKLSNDVCHELTVMIYGLLDLHADLCSVFGCSMAAEWMYCHIEEPHGAINVIKEAIKTSGDTEGALRAWKRKISAIQDVSVTSAEIFDNYVREFDDTKEFLHSHLDYIHSVAHLPLAVTILVVAALRGYLWNTDEETKNILYCIGGRQPFGEYYPLSRNTRNRLFIGLALDGSWRRMIVTGVWVEVTNVTNAKGRPVLTYRKSNSIDPEWSMRHWHKSSQELGILKERIASALLEIKSPAPELMALHSVLKSLCATSDVNWQGGIVSSIIDEHFGSFCSRMTISTEEALGTVFGSINVTYTFLCEPDDPIKFANLMYLRSLRLISPRTSVQGVLLYNICPSTLQDSSLKTVVKDVFEHIPEFGSSALNSLIDNKL